MAEDTVSQQPDGSNAFEPGPGVAAIRVLQLEDSAGGGLSRFPALAGRHAGTSLSRSRPEAFDDDLAAFAEHSPPGASPGATNY